MESKYSSLAAQHDHEDILSSYQSHFYIDPQTIYLDGNSLGKMPLASLSRIQELMGDQWSKRMIRSWNDDWIHMPNRVSEKIAKLLNAEKEEIIICDNTSVNLFKLFFSTLTLQKERMTILIDDNNFPTDRYLLEGLVGSSFPNHEIVTLPASSYGEAATIDIESHIDTNVAMLALSHVLYKSGYRYDMKSINTISEKYGVINIWDLSHSMGAFPIDVKATNTKMAVGCTYKYLNGGPGSPAFIYVSKDILQDLSNPISAWFGHAKPFDFSKTFVESESISKFQTGTPSILSLAPLETSIGILLDADIHRLRAKSIMMTNFFIEMVQEMLSDYNFEIVTPIDENKRGSHISFAHEEAYRIAQALINPAASNEVVVIPDFRPPSYLRFGFAPLYNTFEEVYRSVIRLKNIMAAKEYEQYSKTINGVP